MLHIVTIYEKPTDFPDSFVARRFTVGKNGVVFSTSDYQISPTIEPLREWAKKQISKRAGWDGCNMGRCINDEPHIVESWL